MRLQELVKLHAEWHKKNFGMPDANRSLQKLTEEVGELNGAVYKRDEAALENAIGDVFYSLLGVCRAYGLELRPIAEEVWMEIKDRDYVKFPKTGRQS